MILESEIITLVLGIGVLIFIYFNRVGLRHIPHFIILMTAFCMYLAGWTLAIVENFFLVEFLNHLEHLSHTIGSIFVAVWCWKQFALKEALK